MVVPRMVETPLPGQRDSDKARISMFLDFMVSITGRS